MATLETQKLDSIIASRRSMLLGGGAALAALALTGTQKAAAAVPTAVTDVQILNFALNLEYLEANFYTIATEGVTADMAATGPITLPSGSGKVNFRAGAVTTFSSPAIAAYAFETALEERHHVKFLQTALGKAAVAQPNIELQASFTALGGLIGAPTFDPFTNDLMFLLGAFIFEDVGVTAYHGGALSIQAKGAGTAADPDYLTPAAGIHAVEAYHAGLVRFSLYGVDQGAISLGTGNPGMGQAAQLASLIAAQRAKFDGTYGAAPTSGDTVGLTGQDDFGLSTVQVPLNGTAGVASTILDTGRTTTPGYSNYIAFSRTFQQVLNIVYASPTGAKGGFFPNGLNGDIN